MFFCTSLSFHQRHALSKPFLEPHPFQLAHSTVALRLDLSGNPTFSQLLERAKEMTTAAFAHGTTPFSRVVDALGTIRSAAHTPIYQAMLAFNSAAEPGEGPLAPWRGLRVVPVAADRGQLVQTDLILSINMR
jgi:non-ribosomal peptide synthetase component F